MEFKHRRGSVLIIFDKLSKLLLLILLLIVSVIFSDTFDFVDMLAPIIFILFSMIASLIGYCSTYYTVEENQLVVESGIFNKKRLVMSFDVITTVDLSQNLIFQLFNSYKIKIDNSSRSSGGENKTEIVLVLKKEEALWFKDVITKSKTQVASEQQDNVVMDQQVNITQEDVKNEISYSASFLDFLKLGALQSKISYALIIGSLLYALITAFITQLTDVSFEVLVDSFVKRSSVGFLIFSTIIFFYVSALIYSIVKSFIKYFDFKITSSKSHVKIQYGLFTKKFYTFPKNMINGITLRQNLLMRLFGYYSLEMVVMGYGEKTEDEEEEKALIFPIASQARAKEILSSIFPNYEIDFNYYKPERKALIYFFLSIGNILSLILLVVSLITGIAPLIIAAVLLLVFSAGSSVLKYYNTGIKSSEENVNVSHGGYHRNISIIKTARIESITTTASLLKRKQGVVSIMLGFVAPMGQGKIIAPNLPIAQFEVLEGKLKY